MGTRSAVGEVVGEGQYRAVYVHWDGYPEHMVPVLFRLHAAHDGDVSRLIRYLIDEHPMGWSSLRGTGRPARMRAEHEEGFDLHYDDDEGEAIIRGTLKAPPEHDMGIEWLYLVDDDGVGVFKVGGVGFFGMSAGDEFFTVDHFAWADGEPDEERLSGAHEGAIKRVAEIRHPEPAEEGSA